MIYDFIQLPQQYEGAQEDSSGLLSRCRFTIGDRCAHSNNAGLAALIDGIGPDDSNSRILKECQPPHEVWQSKIINVKDGIQPQ